MKYGYGKANHPCIERNLAVLRDLKPGAYSLLYRMTDKPNEEAFLLLGERQAYLQTGQGREFALRLELAFLARFITNQYLVVTDKTLELINADETPFDTNPYLSHDLKPNQDYKRVDDDYLTNPRYSHMRQGD